MSRQRECGTKQKHTTRQRAFNHLNGLVRRTGAYKGTYSVYKCSKCHAWHVGHYKRRRHNK